MPKNIVLCSDGTGNQGGTGQETNVWRIYQAVDRHRTKPGEQQIAFYDDGVGTEDNKYLRILGGALGLGFTRNVKDLYKFLVKNYQQDDDIYMFGFSRGAYTVRALAAFVTTCGVIENAVAKTERQLDDDIKKLIRTYVKRPKKPGQITVAGVDVTHPDVKCVGVWDTVSAIGVPFDIGLKRLVEALFKFEFRDQDLGAKVKHGFHALAVDDERKSFHPVAWHARDGVEQVWFAGVHSNVGGGYPKQGMAYVSLDWMMEQVASDPAKGWGLYFEPGLRDAAKHHANVHDKLYDSRAGIAAYYRYAPRDIEALIPKDEIKIHECVFDRIARRTLGYGPGNMPSTRKIEIVATRGAPADPKRQARINKAKDDRAKILQGARMWIAARKALHLAFVLLSMLIAATFATEAIHNFFPTSAWAPLFVPALFTLVVVAIMLHMRNFHSVLLSLLALGILAIFQFGPKEWFGGPITPWSWFMDILIFALPDLLAGLVHGFIAIYPYGLVAVAIAVVAMWVLKIKFRGKTGDYFERACKTLR